MDTKVGGHLDFRGIHIINIYDTVYCKVRVVTLYREGVLRFLGQRPQQVVMHSLFRVLSDLGPHITALSCPPLPGCPFHFFVTSLFSKTAS